MNDELDRQLCEKYPKIFRNRHSSELVTCMNFGFEHGDGWFSIIDALCANVQSHVNSKRFDFKDLSDEEFDEKHQTVAAQVKEKFGGLRFYVDNCDDYIRGAVAMAESMSYRTCEHCGAQGRKRSGGWIRTLCDGCDVERKITRVTVPPPMDKTNGE